MSGGEQKNLNNEGGIKKLELDSLTPPVIANGNIKSKLHHVQKNILKLMLEKGNKFTIKGSSKVLHCDPKNIKYHLNKLQHLGYVNKEGEHGIWFLTDFGKILLEGGIKKLESIRGGTKKLEQKNLNSSKKLESFPLREKAIKRTPPKKKNKLFKVEKETIRLYFEELMTPEQISDHRGVSISAVYDTINRLKKKGFWRGEQKNLNNEGGGKELTSSNNKFRLHAEQFYIKILEKSNSYKKSIEKKGKDILYDGNITILYNSQSVQIISKLDFFSKLPLEAQSNSIDFWTTYIKGLERKLKIKLLEPGINNIRYVKSGEYSDIQNDIAKSYNNRKEKLMVRGTDDGKVWLHIDKSFKRDEFEYSHPERSLDDAIHIDETLEDIEKAFTGVEDTFNDIRNKFNISEPFKPSEIINMLGSVTVQINKFQNHFKRLQTNIGELVSSQQTTNKMMKEMVQELGASQKISVEMFNNLMQVLTPQTASGNYKTDDDRGFKPEDSSVFM